MTPPRTTTIGPLNFLATFLVATLLNNDRRLVVTVHEVNLHGPFYVALSSLTLLFYFYANVHT